VGKELSSLTEKIVWESSLKIEYVKGKLHQLIYVADIDY